VYQYYAAAEAMRLIRDRISNAGVIRMLELIGAGASFEDAYAAVTAEPFSAFSSSYAARIRAIAPAYPGITTAPDTVAGPGMSIVFFGFGPNTQITYTVSGAGSTSIPRTVAVSPYGTTSTYLGAQWQPGTYTITATYSGGSVSTTGVKTSSVDFAGAQTLMPGDAQIATILELPETAAHVPVR
jgi:hypothetical protein